MEPTLEGAVALVRSATGALSPHLEAFVTSLIGRQYAVISLRSKAWHATALDTWLAEYGVCLADLDDAHIDQFHRRSYQPRIACRAEPRCHEVSALHQLLRYLRECGLCAPLPTTAVPADDLVTGFEWFLVKNRGFARARFATTAVAPETSLSTASEPARSISAPCMQLTSRGSCESNRMGCGHARSGHHRTAGVPALCPIS